MKSIYLVKTVGNEILFTYHIVENCVIKLDKLELKANLIVLKTYDYDIIVGMNCLSEKKVVIDYHARQLLILSCEPYKLKEYLEIVSDYQVELARQVPLLGEHECLGLNEHRVASELRKIPKVQEYLEVFPIYLPGLPTAREVEFEIKLAPRATSMSTSTYRMAIAKMVELKKQLDKLLEKGFVRPSVSP